MDFWSYFYRTKSYFWVANVGIGETSTTNLSLSISAYGSSSLIVSLKDFKFGVVIEFHWSVWSFNAIQSHLNIWVHEFTVKRFLVLIEFWRAAFDGLLVNYSPIHVSTNENTLYFSKTHVDKVCAFNCHLSVAICGTTLRFNAQNSWGLVIKITNLLRLRMLAISLVSDWQWDRSWTWYFWRKTFYLSSTN